MIGSPTEKRNPKKKISPPPLSGPAGRAAKLRAKRSIMAFLREVTSSYQFGKKKKGASAPTQRTATSTTYFYNLDGRSKSWSSDDLAAHFGFSETLYYAGAGNKGNDFTLVMIDIDVQKALKLGSPAGALAFVQSLRDNYFPNLYWEPSTNGRGIHAYLILQKEGYPGAHVNGYLKRLQTFLTTLVGGHDIEMVEVKGTCPIVTWEKGDDRQMRSIRYGMLAKLPREGDRFDELRNTTLLTVPRLCALMAAPLTRPQTTKIPLARTTPRPRGSCPGTPLKGRILSGLTSGAVEKRARQMIGADGIAINADLRLTPHDLAMIVTIVAHCTQDPNDNGTLPTARAKAIHDLAYDNELTKRPWNHYRWAAGRNWLQAHGYLSTTDMAFHPGWTDGRGDYHKGTAAKWTGNQALMEVVLGKLNSPGSHPQHSTSMEGAELTAQVKANSPGSHPQHSTSMEGAELTAQEARHREWLNGALYQALAADYYLSGRFTPVARNYGKPYLASLPRVRAA